MPPFLNVVAHSALAIIFILGSCIFVHELGHFVAARLARMRVEEFMIGFPPRLFSLVRGETRYGLGLIIFGGFCRIAGMEPGQEDVEGGFYTKSRLSQVAVLIAGAGMNVLLGVGLFTFAGIHWGIPLEPVEPPTIASLLKGDVPAKRAAFQPGDVIVALDGHRQSLKVEHVKPGSLGARIGLQPGDFIYTVNDQEVAVPSELIQRAQQARGPITIVAYPTASDDEQRSPKTITATMQELGIPKKPVSAEHLEKAWGVTFAPLLVPTTQIYVTNRPRQPIEVTIRRGGQERQLTVVPAAKSVQVEEQDASGKSRVGHKTIGQIGVTFVFIRNRSPGFALREGLRSSLGVITGILKMIWETVTGRAAFEASGVVGIAYQAVEHARVGWDAVFQLGGLISVNLAIINLLPIPVTDGGRLLLVGYEAIVRRRISSQREMAWLMAGVVLILGLFIFLTFKDVWNLAKYRAP